MTQRFAVALVFAGLMTAVAAEEGDPFDPVPPPVSPVSLKPVEPVNLGVKKIEPATDLKTEPKIDPKPEPEPKTEESSEPKVVVKSEMPTGFDRFKVLVQRNMFSKERGRPREESKRERKREAPPVPRIEADLVLIGVVQKDGLPAAIVENRVSGKIVTLKPGDSIGAGVAKVISLDSIDFEADGILHVIRIGSTLAGTAPKTITTVSETPAATTPAPSGTALPSPLTSTTTSTGPAAPASPAGSAGESVLERMRRKRQEELRK